MKETRKLPLTPRSSLSNHSSSTRLTSNQPTERTPKIPLKFLRPTKENRRGSMDDYIGSVGTQARLDFLDTFYHVPQFSQRNSVEKLEHSPNLVYLDAINKNCLNPNPFGIVRRKGPENSIDIHGYRMGDLYAEAFSVGIKQIKELNILNLKSNRLTDSGAAQILKNLESKKVKAINLSENRISNGSTFELVKILKSYECRLKVLELENTHIGLSCFVKLCEAITENKKLNKLGLAKNSLDNKAIPALSEMIKYNSSLKYLDLHWNSLGVECGNLMHALGENIGLLYIDLSYNSLGQKNDSSSSSIGRMLSVNKTLKHIDLSNNYFSSEECEIIAEGLKDNHTLYGIHVQGNDCVIDAKGYMIPKPNLNKTEFGHLHKRLLVSRKFKTRLMHSINCWICENWVEVTIIHKIKFENLHINLHLECDEYRPTVMKEHSHGLLAVTRIVPPGYLKFFFSDSDKIFLSEDYNTHILQNPIKLEHDTKEGETLVEVIKVNLIFIETENWKINQEPNARPRNDPRLKERTETVLERVEWKIENSSFKDYKFDTEELLTECCKFDFQVSNLKDILITQEEQQEALEALKGSYKTITEIFRHLSSMSGIELFSISKNVLADFLKKCNFEDEENVIQQIGILWNLSNAPQSKGEKFNAGNGLCRYEFAEFLVRLSINLYLKTGKIKKLKDSFKFLIEKYIVPGVKKFDQSSWHLEKYLKEDVDHFFLLHRPVLEAIFFKYAAIGKGPTDRMSLPKFRLMCTEAGLCNTNSFVMREIDMCFRQAMMTEVDEILSGEHLEMVYVEFIEGLARIADQIFDERDGNVVCLKKKLEGMFEKLKSLCPLRVLNAFKCPTEDDYEALKYVKKVITVKEYIHPV